MRTRQELKTMAKEQISGKIGILFVISLIIGAISFAATFILSFIPFVGSILSIFVSAAFSLSIVRIYQGLALGKQPDVSDSFSGFDDLWTAFKALLLVGLFTYLWTLLFIIPGIIKGISYSQTMYVVAENKGIGAREAIKRSKAMMDGHKMDYFVLSLSFIGWILLSSVTCGLAMIYVNPYMNATMVNFYNDIKPQFVDASYTAPVNQTPEV